MKEITAASICRWLGPKSKGEVIYAYSVGQYDVDNESQQLRQSVP